MTKILFICHGSICRSPMCEFVLKDMVQKRGIEDCFEISSAATSREEIGNPVYPPARRKLAENGITCSGHRARQITKADWDYYDMVICMEDYNIGNLQRVLRLSDQEISSAMEPAGGKPAKLSLLLDYAPESYCRGRRDVADPWYTGNFNASWSDITEGCMGLLEKIV